MTVWQGIALDNDLGAHAQAWDALNRAHFGNHPLLDSRFWNGLLRSFGHAGIQLWVLRDHAEVRAMCLLSYRSWGVWETFLPPQAQVGPVMIGDIAMVDGLLAALGPLALQLDLRCVDPAICDLQPPPGRETRVIPHALTMNVVTDGSYEAYWQRRSAGLRKNLRRYGRLADEAGLQLRLQVTRETGAVTEAVRRYGELESHGWKGEEGTSIAPDNAQGQFYASMLETFAQTGQAAVHELWADDRLVASRLTIESGTTRVILKTTYDESLARYALGWQLLSRSLQLAFEDPALRRVEFYTNASSTQLAWADSTRWIWHISVMRKGPACHLMFGLRTLRLGLRAREQAADQDLSAEALPMSLPWPPDVKDLLESAAARLGGHVAADFTEAVTCRATSDAPEVALWVLRRAGKAVAALALRRSPAGSGLRLETLGGQTSAALQVVMAPEVRAEMLAVLFRKLAQHHGASSRIVIGPLDPLREEYHLLSRGLELAGLACAASFVSSCWRLALPTSWGAYLAGRSAEQRHEIERASRLPDPADARIEIVTTAAEADHAIAAYLRMAHACRGSQRAGGPGPDGVAHLARRSAAAGRLRVGLLWRGDTPVAVQIWVIAADRAEIHGLAHDPAVDRAATAGRLTAALLRHAIERDAAQEVLDLVGDDAAGRIWMSERSERWALQARHPRYAGPLARLLRWTAGRRHPDMREQSQGTTS